MSRRQHFLEADERAREQNLRFVRNPDDDFQQFLGGSGSTGSIPPRDYKVVTPKPGTIRGNNMNALEERAQFFCHLGLPKYEACNWAERSLKNASFNLECFQNRRVDLRDPNIKMGIIQEIKNALQQPFDNNLNIQRFIKSASSSIKGNSQQSFGEIQKRSRSRSPSNFTNWDNSQQRQLNFMEYNHGFNHNNLRMGNSTNQSWPAMFSDNSQNMSQQLFNNNSLNSSINNFIEPGKKNNGNRRLNNQSQCHQNHQRLSSEFQEPSNINLGRESDTFNQNNWKSNNQQHHQYHVESNEPWLRRNANNSNNSPNLYNNQNFNQFPSNYQVFPRHSNQSFQNSQNESHQFQETSDILSLLKNPNFQKFVQQAQQFQEYSQRYRENNAQGNQEQKIILNSNNVKSRGPLPNVARSTQNFRGPKHESLKNRPISNRQKSNLKNLKNKNVLNTNSEIFNKQISKFAPKTGMIQKEIKLNLPKLKGVMPSRKNWINWWKANIWVEKKVMAVDDKDPEIIKTFSIASKNQPNEIMKQLIECRETMSSLLKNARETQIYRAPISFIKCRVLFHKLLFEYKGRGIAQNERKACENLLNQITVVDMVLYYKSLIRKWRDVYVKKGNRVQPRFKLRKLVNQKVFNWLVHLAFKELKRISNSILNPPKKSEQLKDIHELSTKLQAEKKDKIMHFDPNKATAKEFVRSSIDQIKEYLKKAEQITVASSKHLVVTKIRLTDMDLDAKITRELKKEKDDLLEKLKTDPYAKQNYEFLIDEAIKMRGIALNLQEADPKLILPCEKKNKADAKKFLTHNEITVAINHLLDERKAEYGGYLKEDEAAEETKYNHVLLFDDFFEKMDADGFKEDSKPIPIPTTKEGQYKELYEFSSGYNLQKKPKIFFYEPSKCTAEDFVRRTIRFINIYLEKSVPIKTGICKRFVVDKLRLNDNSVDDKISESLKKDKYALIDKLKKDVYAQKNYEHLIDYALIMRMRYFHLRSMDRKLLKDSEKEEIIIYEQQSKNSELKYMCKNLLDERLAETGSYLTAADIAEEKTKKTISDDKGVILTRETLHEMNDTEQSRNDTIHDGDEENGDEDVYDNDQGGDEHMDDDLQGKEPICKAEGNGENYEDDNQAGDEDDDVQFIENEENEDEDMKEED